MSSDSLASFESSIVYCCITLNCRNAIVAEWGEANARVLNHPEMNDGGGCQ